MTDAPASPGEGAPAGQAPARHAAALKVRLPVLRRPPGWGVLDEPALRVRATHLYLACMQQVRQAADGGPEALPSLSGLRPPPAPYGACASGLNAVPDTHRLPAVAAPAVASAAPARPAGAHWPLLPWLLLLGGAMVLTPWLIWAPLVGGLCLGLLLLQTGMLRHWLQARTPYAPEPDGGSSLRSGGGAAEDVVEAVQGVGTRRLRFAHGGWMLTAALVLVGVQAAMLITTLQLKSREPAAIAGAIRAAHPGRAGRQGTPPGPQEAPLPLPDRAAAAAAPRPADEPAGTRREAAP